MTFDTARVVEQEQLARFILDKGHYSATKWAVKRQAFSPPSDLRLSVVRISSNPPPGLISEEEIWTIARIHVEPTRRRTVLARADLTALDIAPEGLRLEPNPAPHPRHANIVGWPEEKEKQMDITKTLAAKAKLVLRPPT